MIGAIRGTSQLSVNGTVRRVDTYYSEAVLIKQRLLRLYPEANQRVFAGLVQPLTESKAYQLSDDKFKVKVVDCMAQACAVMYPNGDYNKLSSYTLLYIAIDNFLGNRDKQLRGIA